jgi:WD40 repeat protein
VVPYEADDVRLHHADSDGYSERLVTSNHASAALSPGGERLAVDTRDDVLVYDVKTRKLLHTLHGHAGTIYGLAYSPAGDLLASASHDRIVRLWSADGAQQAELGSHRDGLADVQFTPDGKTLVSIDDSGVLKLTHVATRSTLLDIPTETRRLRKLALAPDSRRLAVLREDHSILVLGVAEQP